MKYTDFLFSFPIRIYDSFSIMKSEIEEDKTGEPVPAQFIVGAKRVYHNDIRSWHDGYAKDHNMSEVVKDGFPCTIVETTEGSYLCTWDRKKFEEKLNIFVDKIESFLEEQEEEFIKKDKKID